MILFQAIVEAFFCIPQRISHHFGDVIPHKKGKAKKYSKTEEDEEKEFLKKIHRIESISSMEASD